MILPNTNASLINTLVMESTVLQIQLQALFDSILHWEENVSRVKKKKRIRITHKDCPCCAIWNEFDPNVGDDCIGCPIHEFTNTRYCGNTPYEKVASCIETLGSPTIASVRDELEYLKRLYTLVAGEYSQVVRIISNEISCNEDDPIKGLQPDSSISESNY
jgi:hypothetical protein